TPQPRRGHEQVIQMTNSICRISSKLNLDLSDEMHPERIFARLQAQTRRHFLRSMTSGLGAMFLGTLASPWSSAEQSLTGDSPRLDMRRNAKTPLAVLPPQFAPRARRVIYLHMAGAPSQLELFDYKPELARFDGQDCPATLLAGKRFA